MNDLLADAVVVLHLAFVVFVVFGGLLVLRARRVAWVHVPAFAWAAIVEFAGLTCPLTPLENYFREAAGGVGYQGDFLQRYLGALIYPDALTREAQLAIGAFVLVINGLIYWFLLATDAANAG